MAGKVIVERAVMVPMRDGVKLATDIYRPEDGGKHPVLVHGLPYSRSNATAVAGYLFNPFVAVERGYVVVVQESRGRCESEGTWRPFADDGRDGYDTVEWAAAQPWSNGSVGIFGNCADGVPALQAAVAAPPHLKACLLYMTGTNYHSGWIYNGGAFELGFNLAWTAGALAPDVLPRLKLEPTALQEAGGELMLILDDMPAAARYLPLRDIPAFQNGVAPYWNEWLSHPRYDEYWQKVDAVAHAKEIKVPVLQISGWYDLMLRGHLDLIRELQLHGDESVRDHHRMIIGPWDHEAYLGFRVTNAGQRDFGPSAATGPALMVGTAFEWFDRWLLGQDTPLLKTAKFRYFVMGDKVWREESSWPPDHTPMRYYLHSGGRANTRMGDGALTTEPPGSDPHDSYVYDPFDPVPTAGGRTLLLVPGGVQNQAQVEERPDVLVYTSPRLDAPVTIAGPVSVTLFASSSAPDTDFTAKLVDAEPDGYCANIAEGIIRARYRNSEDREEMLEPGIVTEFVIDLWDVAHTFRPGHRIRLEISSSNFPRFDRNLNARLNPAEGTAEDASKAIQQVHHSTQYPSRITLPLMS